MPCRPRTSVPRGTPLTHGTTPDLRSLLAEGLAALELTVTAAQVDQLVALSWHLDRWSKRINLTGHRGPEAIVRGLFLEAAALLSVLPPVRSVVDLGSGAGFPGLPIGILAPRCQVVLVESRERRHYFQRAALRDLALPNVEARRGRAEQLTPTASDMVIAQAVAGPDEVLPIMFPWARLGGWVVVPSGEAPRGPREHPGVFDVRVVRYEVPLGGRSRSLWMGRRGPREGVGRSPQRPVA